VNWVAFEGGALLRVGLMAAIVVGAALLYFAALMLSGLKLRQFVRK
jgi:putative peptidoglycan lipid II flippase